MDLTRKFQEATCNNTVRINELEIDRKYPIVETRYFDTKNKSKFSLRLYCIDVDYIYNMTVLLLLDMYTELVIDVCNQQCMTS
jgi:hypothetical protein